MKIADTKCAEKVLWSSCARFPYAGFVSKPRQVGLVFGAPIGGISNKLHQA
jgi:hypothetical protein